MMVEMGDADAMVGGLTQHYPQTIRPALQCIGVKEGLKIVSGMYIVIIKRKVYFFADCTVNVDPTPEQLAEIAINARLILLKSLISFLKLQCYHSVILEALLTRKQSKFLML